MKKLKKITISSGIELRPRHIRNNSVKINEIIDLLNQLHVPKTKEKQKKEALETLWDLSDDAYGSGWRLSELYDNVPEDIDVMVWVNEFHDYDCDQETKKKVMEWMNEN